MPLNKYTVTLVPGHHHSLSLFLSLWLPTPFSSFPLFLPHFQALFKNCGENQTVAMILALRTELFLDSSAAVTHLQWLIGRPSSHMSPVRYLPHRFSLFVFSLKIMSLTLRPQLIPVCLLAMEEKVESVWQYNYCHFWSPFSTVTPARH